MKEGIIEKEKLAFLEQLIKSLEEANEKLISFYENKDSENFIKTKKFILEVQRKISEVLK